MNDIEIWKDIKDFENYEVSNFGRVRNKSNGQFPNGYIMGNGYKYIMLKKDDHTKKMIGLHRLVASNFVNNPDSKKKVMHVDGNKLNNGFDNLKWVFRNEFEKKPKKEKQVIDKSKFIIKEDINNELIEEWKAINEYENYEISNFGRIKNINNGKILKQVIVAGYYTVGLTKKKQRKTLQIHSLVAKSFLDKNKNDNKIIDHKDNNKLNNRIDNLRLITQSENINSFNANYKKTKFKKILQYDMGGNLIREWNSVTEIEKNNFGYNVQTIRQCCCQNKNSLNYSYFGSKWKYKDSDPEIKLEQDEIFKTCVKIKDHYFNNYEVSNYGKVKNVKTNKYLKPSTTEHGYLTIMIYDVKGKGFRFLIHTLVALLFVDNPNSKNIVNHIDENKQNNHYKNLEWVTYRENAEHSFSIKVEQIDIRTGKILNTFDTLRRACEHFNKSSNYSGQISDCCKGKRQTVFGYRWKFVN